ncbi:MAG: type I phosphomannose isomerase catalytic subunit [Hydrogenoanaerobacterium sp.]
MLYGKAHAKTTIIKIDENRGNIMHPMLLSPIYKDYLWGGERLKKEYGKKTELTPLAESWELSCHKDGVCGITGEEYSTLAEFLDANPQAMGEHCKKFSYFPILFKLIDAKDNLSLQVHPNDEYALREEGEYGKTEQWIVLAAEPGAKLIMGFKNDITKEELQAKIADNTILDVANLVPVKSGDVFFINAGVMHGIGKGIVIAEIQQNSNTTYRVYDYGRVGADGKPRKLHIEKALDVTETSAFTAPLKDFTKRIDGGCVTEALADCKYFKTERLTLDGVCKRIVDKSSFEGLFCAEGSAEVKSEGAALKLQKGQTAFLPANLGAYTLSGAAQLISMRV